MKLLIDNVRCVLTDLTAEERTQIKNFLTRKDKRTGFVRNKFDPTKVKSEKFYYENKAGILFFTGLIKDVLPLIKGKITSVENNTNIFDYQKKDYTDEELRAYFNPKFKYVDHQIRALRSMLKSSKGITKATTSAGKTEIFIAFLKATNLKSLIIVPKVDLAKQVFERVSKAGIEAGIMTGSSKKYNGENVCISTPQMALALLDRDFECIICDEVHHACAATYQEFLKSTKAKIMFGFSATPDTNEIDFMKIKQFFGNIAVEINAQELLENDVIVFPEIKFVPIHQRQTPDWPTANDLCIIHNEERNEKIKELVEQNEKPALVLIRNIEHGEELNRIIEGSCFLSGRDDSKVREEVLSKFENKELDCLIGTFQILGEGVSINAIRTLIIGNGGKSDIVSTQNLGRALRRDGDDKKMAKVFDFYDIGNKYTESHSVSRAKTYKNIGFPIDIKK